MMLSSTCPPGVPLGGLLGRLGSLLGASRAVLGHLEARLGRLGCLLGRLGGILESSWPSWSHLGCLEGEFGGHLGPSWPSWTPSRAILEDLFRPLRWFGKIMGGRRDGPKTSRRF